MYRHTDTAPQAAGITGDGGQALPFRQQQHGLHPLPGLMLMMWEGGWEWAWLLHCVRTGYLAPTPPPTPTPTPINTDANYLIRINLWSTQLFTQKQTIRRGGTSDDRERRIEFIIAHPVLFLTNTSATAYKNGGVVAQRPHQHRCDNECRNTTPSYSALVGSARSLAAFFFPGCWRFVGRLFLFFIRSQSLERFFIICWSLRPLKNMVFL